MQQLLLGVLTPIWEARFSKSSYGFRPGRSQHDAIRAAQQHIKEGKTYVVDLDIEKLIRCAHPFGAACRLSVSLRSAL